MEDETLGFFKKTSSSHARLNVPALVQVAALAIIMIRGLDVLMIFNTLGVRGIGEFIHRSVQTWSLTLVFLSSPKTVGLVSLPGMMSGLIFAGIDPVKAIKYQIMVTFMLLSTASLSTIIACYLTYRKFYNSRHQLVVTQLKKK